MDVSVRPTHNDDLVTASLRLMDEKRLNLFPANVGLSKGKSTKPEAPDGSGRPNGSGHTDRQQRELDRMTGTADTKKMTIPLGTMVPLLIRAYENDHTWLRDFADDVVQIDADLHEVLTAFRHMPDRRAA